jgi:predicted GNAT superfamily acetyltransferase
MQRACAVLDRVWEIPQGQTSEIQPHLLRALGHGGNYLVGAYQPGTAMVGASVAFFTEPLGSAMHSHITGVLPGAAGRGVGAALKWHQRQWAMERGLTRITWTFDPLIARNSFFNLTRLGARPETYFVDFYGVMHDGPNRGQPTDRMQVGWDLSAVSTIQAQAAALDGSAADDGPDVSSWTRAGAVTLLSAGPAGEPVRGRMAGPEVTLAVIGVPRDIEQIRRTDPAQALSWRYALRSTLALVIADSSWKVIGFARAGWYLLQRESSGAAHGGVWG